MESKVDLPRNSNRQHLISTSRCDDSVVLNNRTTEESAKKGKTGKEKEEKDSNCG